MTSRRGRDGTAQAPGERLSGISPLRLLTRLPNIPPMSNADLFTQAAAARFIGVKRQAVEHRIKVGKIRPTILGGVTFVARGDLLIWRKERTKRARALTQEGR